MTQGVTELIDLTFKKETLDTDVKLCSYHFQKSRQQHNSSTSTLQEEAISDFKILLQVFLF